MPVRHSNKMISVWHMMLYYLWQSGPREHTLLNSFTSRILSLFSYHIVILLFKEMGEVRKISNASVPSPSLVIEI